MPAIGAEINCCFDSDTEIGLMKQKYINRADKANKPNDGPAKGCPPAN